MCCNCWKIKTKTKTLTCWSLATLKSIRRSVWRMIAHWKLPRNSTSNTLRKRIWTKSFYCRSRGCINWVSRSTPIVLGWGYLSLSFCWKNWRTRTKLMRSLVMPWKLNPPSKNSSLSIDLRKSFGKTWKKMGESKTLLIWLKSSDLIIISLFVKKPWSDRLVCTKISGQNSRSKLQIWRSSTTLDPKSPRL